MKYRNWSSEDKTQSIELGAVKKKWKDKLPVALVFPNVYSVGMSNLGFQLIYEMLNRHSEIVCERFFFDTESRPLSIESNRPLADFPIILFSVSFEQDFLNIVTILDRAGIEPVAENRLKEEHVGPDNPIVIGGGVATFINPEPLAPFFDILFLGEAEPVLPGLIATLKEQKELTKEAILEHTAITVSGCYVPSLYRANYNSDGTFADFSCSDRYPGRIKKIVHENDDIAGHSQLLTPKAEFSNIFLTELGRGCSRGCRFCAAGYVYRPPRLWSSDSIIKAIQGRPKESNRVGLLGMEMAKLEDLEAVAAYLLKENCSLSFSSLRADIINPTILNLLSRSALKSAAIAPDGASERLRKVISKNITHNDILNASESLVGAGVKNLKLYFMIGLPTESIADLDEMINLVKTIHGKVTEIGRARGYLSEIILSVNSFVPKAWTPFQYYGFLPVNELKKRIKYLRKGFAGIKNLKISFDNPDKAYFQATLARGDRKVGEALVKVSRTGRNWRQVFKEEGVDPLFYAGRERGKDEYFPWEIVDHGLKKEYLWNEYQQALKNNASKGCGIQRELKCRRCGVCNDRGK